MSLRHSKKKSNWSSDTEYRVRFENDIPHLPLRKIFVAHPKLTFNMGNSGPAGSKRSHFIPTEIWLRVIKNAMPSTMSVTKKCRTGIANHGFHLRLWGSSLSFIMKLARLSKTWYWEVKEALYAQPTWAFDSMWNSLYHFLNPFSSEGSHDDTSFVEYDAAISRIRHVELMNSQHIYAMPRSSWTDVRRLDLLSPLSRLMHIGIGKQTTYDGARLSIIPSLATTGDVLLILSSALHLTAKLGNRMSRVFSFEVCFSKQREWYVWDSRLEKFKCTSQEAERLPAALEEYLRTMIPKHMAAVLSDASLVASARAKETHLLAFRCRAYANARAAAKVPKAHVKLPVKRVYMLIWGLWTKAPESMRSRLPRRAKSDAFRRMSGLARKRPRVI